MTELLIGCGARHIRLLGTEEQLAKGWTQLVTLDHNPDHKPDVVWDLENLPLPFKDGSIDEIHAYEVLEHTGQQGDYRFFFAQFADFWRILRPGGLLMGTCPAFRSRWKWGDPSHRRVIMRESFTYLNQEEYTKQSGKTAMSDFRYIYKEDFKLLWDHEEIDVYGFVLEAVKPSRWKSCNLIS